MIKFTISKSVHVRSTQPPTPIPLTKLKATCMEIPLVDISIMNVNRLKTLRYTIITFATTLRAYEIN